MSERGEWKKKRMSEWPSTLRVYSLNIRLTVHCSAAHQFSLFLSDTGRWWSQKRSSSTPTCWVPWILCLRSSSRNHCLTMNSSIVRRSSTIWWTWRPKTRRCPSPAASHPWVRRSVGWLVGVFFSRSVRPSVSLSVGLSVNPSVSLSVRPSTRQFVRPSVCPSVCQLSNVHPSTSQSSVRLAVSHNFCKLKHFIWLCSDWEGGQRSHEEGRTIPAIVDGIGEAGSMLRRYFSRTSVRNRQKDRLIGARMWRIVNILYHYLGCPIGKSWSAYWNAKSRLMVPLPKRIFKALISGTVASTLSLIFVCIFGWNFKQYNHWH